MRAGPKHKNAVNKKTGKQGLKDTAGAYALMVELANVSTLSQFWQPLRDNSVEAKKQMEHLLSARGRGVSFVNAAVTSSDMKCLELAKIGI